jgi:DDE superfamily endonuclease
MNPYPQRNSVLIMDHASTHHFDRLRELVEARYVISPTFSHSDVYFIIRGMRLVYLPAYSPDFNPIEEGFSAMKACIRRNRDYVLGELTGEETCEPFAMLWGAVFATMTTNSIAGWYRDCGLLV